MRKFVLFVGLSISCVDAFSQTHDTTSLKYKITSCYTSEVDTMAYAALVLSPTRKHKNTVHDPWNTNTLLVKNLIFENNFYRPLTIIDLASQQNKDTVDAYNRFNNFNSLVLNGEIKKTEVQKEFKQLVDHINHWLLMRSQIDVLGNDWVFPLKGYNYHAIGGNGDGYSDKGYRYLDGNKHGAHPAHDIFVNDKNQDCIDDHSHQPVDVLAVDRGIVIACSDTWQVNSNLRGGKYIWIYHFAYGYQPNGNKKSDSYSSGTITYYAHNSKIFVRPGQEVKPGQKIAEVGRTGYNAYKKRSPTHLHFSAFKLVDDLPVPFNPYQQLKKAKTL